MRMSRYAGMIALVVGFTAAHAGVSLGEDAAQAGNFDIRSGQVGSRVYLDNEYKGDADIFIENVPAGEHIITVRSGSRTIGGQFILKAGETMMLDARFEEMRVVDLRDVAREEAAKRAEAERRVETEKKGDAEHKKKEAAEPPVVKKPAPQKKIAATEAKKPQKSPEQELRDAYMNILRADFTEGGAGVSVAVRQNQKAVSGFTDSKSATGQTYLTKQGVLLCGTAPCVHDWMGRFFYTDENGKRDAFLIRWKATIFSGITPEGNAKREMDVCLNGQCRKVIMGNQPNQHAMERYVVTASKTSFTIRRADMIKDITDAGEQAPEF